MSLRSKAVGAEHGIKNAAFEALHPRMKEGHQGAGQFIEVQKRMTEMGGTWDEARSAWIVPTENRAQLDNLLADMDVSVLTVPEGMKVASDEDRKTHGIPPAWDDVVIALDPDAKVQAQGRDTEGRLQTNYAAWWDAQQSAAKFERIRRFDKVLPQIDEKLSREAGSDDTAAALMVMRKFGTRTGSAKNTGAKKKAYGTSTLERRHVQVTGDKITLKFDGKSGKAQNLTINDKELASVLRRRLKGKTGDEQVFPGTNGDKMARWIEDVAPGHQPYDFRTHLGTHEAKRQIEALPPPQSPQDFKRQRNYVGDQVSKRLGNTRTVALASYVDPGVFRNWENSDTVTQEQAKALVGQHQTIEERLQEAMRLGIDDWPEQGPAARKILGGAKNTQEKYTVDMGNGETHYVKKRIALHDSIVGQKLAGAIREHLAGVDHPAISKLEAGESLGHADQQSLREAIVAAHGGKAPRALWLAGGPASGKSSALRDSPELKPPGAVEINPDELKEALPEYNRMRKAREKYAATGVHEESSDLAKRLQIEAQDLGLNVVFDGTGDSPQKEGVNKFRIKIQQSLDSGYEADALYVSIPTDEAVIRATLRAIGEWRWVPTDELRSQHINVSRNYDEIKDMPGIGSIKVYDNGGDKPVLMAHRERGGKLNVVNARLHDEFLNKQHEEKP